MKPTRWLMLLLVSVSLFGVACGGAAEPEAEDVDPTEDVSPDELDEEDADDLEEDDDDE